jgi:hypothetical protein
MMVQHEFDYHSLLLSIHGAFVSPVCSLQASTEGCQPIRCPRINVSDNSQRLEPYGHDLCGTNRCTVFRSRTVRAVQLTISKALYKLSD